MTSMQSTRRIERRETSFTSCTSHTFSTLCLENPVKKKGGSLSTSPTVKSNLAHTANNMAITWLMAAYTTCASNICCSCRTTKCFTWTAKKKHSNNNLNYSWDVLMCWRLVWKLDLVLSTYCCVLMHSQKMPFFCLCVLPMPRRERCSKSVQLWSSMQLFFRTNSWHMSLALMSLGTSMALLVLSSL